MNLENKELKNFVKSFKGNNYRPILFCPLDSIITAVDGAWNSTYSWDSDRFPLNKTAPKILDFENDKFLIKKLCAYYALYNFKTIKIDKESFFEMIEITLFDYIEDDKFISTYLSFLKENSYKQIYERFIEPKKNKSFLAHYPELKTTLENLFLEYKFTP